jgi:hypothetical protein
VVIQDSSQHGSHDTAEGNAYHRIACCES